VDQREPAARVAREKREQLDSHLLPSRQERRHQQQAAVAVGGGNHCAQGKHSLTSCQLRESHLHGFYGGRQRLVQHHPRREPQQRRGRRLFRANDLLQKAAQALAGLLAG